MNRTLLGVRRGRMASFVVLVGCALIIPLCAHDARASGEGMGDTFACVAYDAAHSGVVDEAGPPMLGAPRFVSVVPDTGLVGPCTPIVSDRIIYVCADTSGSGHTYTGSFLLALDEVDGALLWSRRIGTRTLDSWSSPCAFRGEVEGEAVDCVVVGCEDWVRAYKSRTGATLWSTQLEGDIVNASPVIGAGRVFITDYTAFGPGGTLYALDVRDGTVDWSREIGQTNGNTPAYDDGAVYVATGDGWVGSYDAADGSPNWEVQLFGGWSEGFAGGVSVRDGALYAATYGFYGGQDNSTLLKLDASTGGVLWSVAAERTDSMPVVLDDKVVLAGGVVGFGSRRVLECFDESNGALLWSYEGAGGWLHQPCAAGGLVYAGLIPGAGYAFGPGSDLHVLDVSKPPGEAGFIVDVYGGCGSSPSVANGNVYSIGTSGGEPALYAFGPPVDPWIDDIVWKQAYMEVRIGFRCVTGDEYVVETVDADAYDDGLTWSTWTTVTATGGGYETISDDPDTNPLAGKFRFYRIRRADGTNTTQRPVGVFELPVDGWAASLYFLSTPLIPDPDHNSVPEIFGEGDARQIPRVNISVSGLDEATGAISRMRNATGTYSVLVGSAFDIEPGIGYELYLGFGFGGAYTLRLTGYVPETSLTVPLTKVNNQAVRWMGYSMPRTIKLSELGLVEAVTPLWSPSNKVRLLPPGSAGWHNYTYDTGAGTWMEYDHFTHTWSPSDPDIVPGMGIVFIRAGFNNLTDELVLPTWYSSPPNDW